MRCIINTWIKILKKVKNSNKSSIENNQVTSINEDKKSEDDKSKDMSMKFPPEKINLDQ